MEEIKSQKYSFAHQPIGEVEKNGKYYRLYRQTGQFSGDPKKAVDNLIKTVLKRWIINIPGKVPF